VTIKKEKSSKRSIEPKISLKEGLMKKLLLVFLALIFVATSAFSWNFATHAYIADQIGKFVPKLNANEMYGIMAPDMFNFDFSLWGDMKLYGYTHGTDDKDKFMKVWDKARGGLAVAAAFGFVAHNDLWGADFTAHHFAQTIPVGKGYIIYLAEQLDFLLDQFGVWQKLADLIGAPVPAEDRMTFCHNVIEYAGDIIIKEADPQIGLKIITACASRSSNFPKVLEEALPGAYKVASAESKFREQMSLYGGILTLDTSEAIDLISQQLADLTIEFMKSKGVDLSPYAGLVKFLCKTAMLAGIQICQGAGYMNEVQATIYFVQSQLAAHGIIY